MSFYDLAREERKTLVEKIKKDLFGDIQKGKSFFIENYFSDEDTYIRKAAYQSLGEIYKTNKKLQNKILEILGILINSSNEKIRQTTINTTGEIGINDFSIVEQLLGKGLVDKHHSVRNAVIGSLKKAGEKNPVPVLAFARKFIHHSDKEIRREICHGIELRGRTHPQDVLPLLKELQFEKTSRVRNMVIHVLGQISYKKNCLETVLNDLRNWENKKLVGEALDEIIDVHEHYRNFAAKTQAEAIKFIRERIHRIN